MIEYASSVGEKSLPEIRRKHQNSNTVQDGRCEISNFGSSRQRVSLYSKQ